MFGISKILHNNPEILFFFQINSKKELFFKLIQTVSKMDTVRLSSLDHICRIYFFSSLLEIFLFNSKIQTNKKDELPDTSKQVENSVVPTVGITKEPEVEGV